MYKRTERMVPARARGSDVVALLEEMEPRLLLSNPAPLPSLADFEDPTNPALRLTTRFGEIDMELLANEVPELVSAFIDGLERGITCDQTFFHRLLPGLVLQGGLFGFVPDSGLGAIPVNIPVDNPVGSGRANTERTVAMGTLLDSGLLTTSSFIINLTDNSANWDPTQAVVFARVIDDRSWDVVQTIASLNVADLTLDTGFAGFFAGSFHNVPVTAPYTPPNEDGDPGTPITNELLTTTYDLAVIKAPGAPDFYRHTLYEPEGFLHDQVREFIPIENPNDEPVYYEVNARFEAANALRALFRDDLVVRGVIAPHSRGGVTLQLGGSGIDSAVRRQDEPFAFELRSTLPLAASLSHYDLGSTIDVPFSGDLATSWFFPRVMKLTDVQDFLVWYNPGNDNSTVTLTLIGEDGVALDPIVFQTERLRRGGINFQMNPDVPDGIYAVRIDSSEPIAISRSHYANSGPPRSRPEGYSEAGATGEASTVGIVPIAADPGAAPLPGDARTLSVTFFNAALVDAVITIDLYVPDSPIPAMTFTGALVVGAGRAGTFSRTLEELPTDAFSLAYTSSAPVYATYSMVRSEAIYGGAVPTVAASEYHFAEGFTDPSRAAPNVLEESLHIFNANAPAFGVAGADANVTITFRFTDGFELSMDRLVTSGTLSRVHISSLDEILEQGRENGRFFYSVEVTSDVPIVVQMLHTDVSLGTSGLPGGGFVLSGTIFGETRRLG